MEYINHIIIIITEQDNNSAALSTSNEPQTKRPNSQSGDDHQVNNLLSLSSLGINSLSALGPVITAMAGLLQGKTAATRRNDTAPLTDVQEVTTQRSPIYIPVAEFVDGDIETAESQHIGNSGLIINILSNMFLELHSCSLFF